MLVLAVTLFDDKKQRPCTSGISVTCAVQQACALPSFSPMQPSPFIRPFPAPQLRVHIHPVNSQYRRNTYVTLLKNKSVVFYSNRIRNLMCTRFSLSILEIFHSEKTKGLYFYLYFLKVLVNYKVVSFYRSTKSKSQNWL